MTSKSVFKKKHGVKAFYGVRARLLPHTSLRANRHCMVTSNKACDVRKSEQSSYFSH